MTPSDLGQIARFTTTIWKDNKIVVGDNWQLYSVEMRARNGDERWAKQQCRASVTLRSTLDYYFLVGCHVGLLALERRDLSTIFAVNMSGDR